MASLSWSERRKGEVKDVVFRQAGGSSQVSGGRWLEACSRQQVLDGRYPDD